MNQQQVEDFRKIAAQLDALYQEMSAASKRGADKAISSFKLKYVNVILSEARSVLGPSSPDIGFSEFDPDDLPTASDVSLIVAQFVQCAEKIRCENIVRHGNGLWYWYVDGQPTGIVATAPKGTH